MGKPIAVVGCPTSHGGMIIKGAPTSDVMGMKIARMGDQVSCPIPGHGVNAIIEGDPTFLVEGMPAALVGHKTACGAVILPLQVTATA